MKLTYIGTLVGDNYVKQPLDYQPADGERIKKVYEHNRTEWVIKCAHSTSDEPTD